MAYNLSGSGSILRQAMVADFIEQGHFARHLRKMRTLYGKRHGYLVDALVQTYGDRVQVQPQVGGMHVLARLKHPQDDKALAAAAHAQGFPVHALSNWRMRKGKDSGLLMGFANFATPEEALASVRRLKAALQDLDD